MLANFRRKTGAMSTMPGTPRMTGNANDEMLASFSNDLDGGLQSLLSLPQTGENGFEGMGDWGAPLNDGFAWPTEFSPSNLPVWLQDGNFTDLGLPQDGSDSLFLPLEYVYPKARGFGHGHLGLTILGSQICSCLLERNRMRITHSPSPIPEMQGRKLGRNNRLCMHGVWCLSGMLFFHWDKISILGRIDGRL
jgi:hypothetical protein